MAEKLIRGMQKRFYALRIILEIHEGHSIKALTDLRIMSLRTGEEVL